MSLKKAFLIRAVSYAVLASLPSVSYGNYIKHSTNQNYIQQNYKIKSLASLTPRFSNSDITEKLCNTVEQDNQNIDNQNILCDVLETKNTNLVYRVLTSRTTKSITEIVEYDSETEKPIRNIPFYKTENKNDDNSQKKGNSNKNREIGFFSITDSGKIDYVRELSEEELVWE